MSMITDKQMDDAMKLILELEGGFANLKGDSGGATDYGITEGLFHSFMLHNGRTAQPVKEIPQFLVRAIYYLLFLGPFTERLTCSDATWPAIMAAFQAGVNCGLSRGIRFLQQALRMTMPTGVIGPLTQQALDAALNKHQVALDVLHAQEQYYRSLNNQTFLHGWLDRIERTAKYIGVEYGSSKS